MKICHLSVLWVMNHGLLKKFTHQAHVFSELSEADIEIEGVVIIRQRILEQLTGKPPFRTITIPKREPQWLEEILLPFDTWRIIDKQICHQYHATVMRWLYPTWRTLQIANRYPLFTEHHTKELDEIRLQRSGIQSWGKYFLERFIAPLVLKKVAGIIGVTNEIRLYELSRSKDQAPSIVIPNGIHLQSIPTQTSDSYPGGQLHMGFLCSRFTEWQGLDRLLTGVLNSTAEAGSVHVHLIGKTSAVQKEFIRENQLQDQVTLHSTVEGSQLNYILQECHIAIGPLAIHRKGLSEASPLKCREYTARGLPFVTSFADPDFPDDCPWILKINADDSAVDIPALLAFAREMGGNGDLIRQQMFEWAENNLGWQKKFQQLLRFVRKNYEDATTKH
jgi:Glycosyl transferases group 1